MKMKIFNKKNNSYYLTFVTVLAFFALFFQNCSKTPYSAKLPFAAAKK